VDYRNPPVVERALGLYANINPELFQRKLESWKDIVRTEFPEDISLTQYLIKSQFRNDEKRVSVVENFSPEVEIVYRFGQEGAKLKRVWSTRFQETHFSINLERDGNKTHQFNQLLEKAKVWIPKWANHFEVESLDNISLHYVNLLSEDFTPQFWVSGEQSGLDMTKAIKVFERMPGNIVSLVPPYNCTMSGVFDGTLCPKSWVNTINVATSTIKGKKDKIAIHVDIVINTMEKVSVANCISKIECAHSLLLTQFEAVFTETALASFKPIQL